jgi:hypothetical protein
MENLPDRIEHGPDRSRAREHHHGPERLSKAGLPGAGLGDDGWRVLTYSQLRALERPYGRRPPTRQFDLHLTGNMHKYVWGFDGKKWSQSDMIRFQYGERLRINMINDTMMSHPIHLHGMWMDLYAGGTLDDNPRKHTVIVQPAELLTVDITADAPGQWAFHCHLLYHMEAGMFRTVAVVRSLEGGPIRADADRTLGSSRSWCSAQPVAAAQEPSDPPTTAERPDHLESAEQHVRHGGSGHRGTAAARRPEPRGRPRSGSEPASRELARARARRPAVRLHASSSSSSTASQDGDTPDHLGWEAQGWAGGDLQQVLVEERGRGGLRRE